MKTEDVILESLKVRFHSGYSRSAVGHYVAAVEKFVEGNSEMAIAKAGKFVEAVMKLLAAETGYNFPVSMRKFNVGGVINHLNGLKLGSHPDSMRLLIPRAGEFVYDISSNRGARHDPNEVDPNIMDASVVIPVCSWILAELIRIADAGSSTPEETMRVVEGLVEKKYSFFEEVGDRKYVNIRGLSAREIALLLLYAVFPGRISKSELIDSISRHKGSSQAASMAVHRLKTVIDIDDDGNIRLRGIGREDAEKILKKVKQNG